MTDARIALIEAIARRKKVTARYNSARLSLAPHALYARRGDLFVAAFNPDKNRRADETPQLGRFKLDGLSEVVITEEGFEPLPSFDPAPEHDEEELLLAV